jgi:hypothetical protein
MGESSLVPSDTPFMQWKGHKFNTKKFIFQSMDACLTQFEDVWSLDQLMLKLIGSESSSLKCPQVWPIGLAN